MTTDTVGGTTAHYVILTDLVAYAIVASASGTLTSIGVNIFAAAGNIRVCIYSTYSGSKLSGILGQSASTPAVGGWNDLAIPGGVAIVSGTTYYIAVLSDIGSCSFFYINSGT